MRQTIRAKLALFLAVALWLTVFLPPTPRAAASDDSGKAKKDETVLRMEVMRFTDRWASKIDYEINKLEAHVASESDKYNLASWKLICEIEAVDIATGPVPAINVLDMATFITVTRLAFENHWLPRITSRKQGAEFLSMMERFETEAWEAARSVLPEPKINALRRHIVKWYGEEHGVWHGKGARVSAYLASLGMELEREDGSLFLPEVSSMANSVDEIRVLGERLMYYMQRINIILQGQAKLLLMSSLKQPEVVKLLKDVHRVSLAAESLAGTAEDLPDILEAKSPTLQSLMRQAESLSIGFNSTLATFGTTLEAYKAVFPPESGLENMEQFRLTMRSLENVLAKCEPVISDLNEMLMSPEFTQQITQIMLAVDQTKEEGGGIINLLALDVVVIIVSFFVCLLLYKFILHRYVRKDQ